MAFIVTSPSFEDGATIPDVHAKDHGNVSPALDWSGAPNGTESYAILVQDPDAPKGTVTHWAVANIPAQQTSVAEGCDLSAFTVLANVFDDANYGGPRPPAGHGPHHYHFRLLALDVPKLVIRPGAEGDALLRAAEGHVVAEAETIGIYENKEG